MASGPNGATPKGPLRQEHPAEPPVILKGDESSVVGRDSDVIMGSGGISVGIMGQQTSGHAEMKSPEAAGLYALSDTYPVGLVLRPGTSKLMGANPPPHLGVDHLR